jgi:hypothetical protein
MKILPNVGDVIVCHDCDNEHGCNAKLYVTVITVV